MDSLPSPAWRPLDARQRRVLGVLIEKAKTTPAGYPMSVNAIVAGSNQKNNRDPITAYDEADVEEAISDLLKLGVVSEVDWLGRVPKYKHRAYEWLGVDKAELAVLAELLLRGAQTLGDLRGRAARMEPIEDLSALKPIVDRLVTRRLMVELTPPGRGQMVTHGLFPPSEAAAQRAAASGQGAVPAPPAPESRSTSAALPEPPQAELASLRDEVRELRSELAAVRERLAALETRPGE